MSTSSVIARLNTDGSIDVITCQKDGYLSHVGVILQTHYTDPAKVAELIALGDLSKLGPEIGVEHPFGCGRDGEPSCAEYQRLYGDMCLAYGRDRGEEETAALRFNETTVFRHWAKTGGDYIYAGHTEPDGKVNWLVKGAGGKGYMTIAQALGSAQAEG